MSDTTIAAVAREVAAERRRAGWNGGGLAYDLGAYPGDALALDQALGRAATADERRALESAIRITLDTGA